MEGILLQRGEAAGGREGNEKGIVQYEVITGCLDMVRSHCFTQTLLVNSLQVWMYSLTVQCAMNWFELKKKMRKYFFKGFSIWLCCDFLSVTDLGRLSPCSVISCFSSAKQKEDTALGKPAVQLVLLVPRFLKNSALVYDTPLCFWSTTCTALASHHHPEKIQAVIGSHALCPHFWMGTSLQATRHQGLFHLLSHDPILPGPSPGYRIISMNGSLSNARRWWSSC